jgi:hypothetical protein
MWKNKHFVIALLVAPVLALIAYFGVDAMVSEKPHAAVEGASYPLRVESNCRYPSGECELTNGDVKLRLTLASDTRWSIESEIALRGALISTALRDTPVAFTAADEARRQWSAPVDRDALTRGNPLRLVVAAGDSQYFAEIPVVFVDNDSTLTR